MVMKSGRIARLLVALALPVAAFGASAAPSGLNTSLERTTSNGLFRVSVKSAEQPIPMNRIHRWTVRITDAQGRPVSGARIAVDGGMPEHRHGLPTAPKAGPGGAPGGYVINGMKFSMDGWWELKLAVQAGGRADQVTFNIVL